MIAEASPRLTPWSGILYTLVTFIACYFHRRTCFMSQETSPQNEAVFLFSGDAIDREMLYPEFEEIGRASCRERVEIKVVAELRIKKGKHSRRGGNGVWKKYEKKERRSSNLICQDCNVDT